VGWTDLNLPPSVRKVVERGVFMGRPKQVLLYGSRARGSHRDNSDFDFAFLSVADRSRFLDFKLDELSEPGCVWPVDFIELERADEDLQANVTKEGVLVYSHE
jgi:predicted nucleotidyltransferase